MYFKILKFLIFRSFARNVETYKMLTRLKPPKLPEHLAAQVVSIILLNL